MATRSLQRAPIPPEPGLKAPGIRPGATDPPRAGRSVQLALQATLASVDARSMSSESSGRRSGDQRRSEDRRRAPRFETRLWVGIPEVEGEPELEKCDISASGMLLRTRRNAGSIGAVRMLRLVTADLGAGINIMALVVRVVLSDAAGTERVTEATAFEFLPHDPQELEDFLRQVVEGEISVAPHASLDRRVPTQKDRRSRGGEAEPATANARNVSGMVIDTSWAVEAGAKISLEIEGSSSDGALRLSGQVVGSRQIAGQIEDADEGECYRVEVSFGEGEEGTGLSVDSIVNTLVPDVMTTNRPVRTREGAHLSGSLSEVALPSLLAFLELERSSGVLAIEQDSNKAAVFVQDGRILDVESGAPASSPIESLADLLDWPEGAFEFSFQVVERDDAVGQSTTAVLMECARISDERSR